MSTSDNRESIYTFNVTDVNSHIAQLFNGICYTVVAVATTDHVSEDSSNATSATI